MNHIYKVIWSKAKHCYVVASEIAKSHGKAASAGKRSLVAAILAAAALSGAALPAQAADAAKALEEQNTAVTLMLEQLTKGNGVKTAAAHTAETAVKDAEPAEQPAEAPAVEDVTADAEKGQRSVFNEDGFYAKQSGTKDSWNSLTKDGLWVGGQNDGKGFHVDNDGNVTTTGTANIDGVQIADEMVTANGVLADRVVSTEAEFGSVEADSANIGGVQIADEMVTAGGVLADRVVSTEAEFGSVEADSANIGGVQIADEMVTAGGVLADRVVSTEAEFGSVKADTATLGGVKFEGDGKITNVAAGRVNATSTDAVNGSQLYQTNQNVEANKENIEELDQWTGKGTTLDNGAGNLAEGINKNTEDLGKLDASAVKYDDSTKGDVTFNPGGEATDLHNVGTINDHLTVGEDETVIGYKDGSSLYNNTSTVTVSKDGVVSSYQDKDATVKSVVTTDKNGVTLESKDLAYATYAKLSVAKDGVVTITNDSKTSTRIDGDTITAGKVTGLRDGVDDTDAVNVSQLNTVDDKVTDVDAKVGSADFRKTTYAQGPTVTSAIYGLDTQVKTNADSIVDLNTYTGYELGTQLNAGGAKDLTTGVNNAYAKAEEAGVEAKKHTTVSTNDNNLYVEETENYDGSTNYNVTMRPEISVTAITAETANIGGAAFKGNGEIDTDGPVRADYFTAGRDSDFTTVDVSGITIGSDPANATRLTNEGLVLQNAKITGLKEGEVSKDSTEAVNGSQLYKVTEDVSDLSGIVGDGKFEGTNYLDEAENLTDAAYKLDTQVKDNADAIDTLSDFAVQYDKKKDGSADYSSVTFKGDGTTLKNVNDIVMNVDGKKYSFQDAGLVPGTVDGKTGMAIGKGSEAGATQEIFWETVSNKGNIAIGEDAKANSDTLSVLFDNGTAAGTNANVQADNGTAFGANTNVIGFNGVAVGESAKAIAVNGTAIGQNANVVGVNGTAVGQGASAIGLNSTAIGAGSVADEKNTVSVGGGLVGNRKVVNVADGTIEKGSHDAVTGGQLWTTNENVTKNANSIGELNRYTGLLSKELNAGDAKDLTTGVNNAYAKAEAAGTEAKKHTTVVKGENIEIDEGENAEGGKEYTVSLSKKINVDSVTAKTAELGGVQFAGDGVAAGTDFTTQYQGQDVSLNDVYDRTSLIRRTDDNLTIIGDTVAVRASTEDHAGGLFIQGKESGTVTQFLDDGSAKIGKIKVSKDGKITGVADGIEDADAVNYGQLKDVSGAVDAVNEKIGSGDFSRTAYAKGDTITDAIYGVDAQVKVNADDLAADKAAGVIAGVAVENPNAQIALGNSSSAAGDSATAIGATASAAGAQSTAIGNGAWATGNNSIAIGYGSIANEDGTVSVGDVDFERRIVNVANGVVEAGSTDAVNGGQLYTVETELGSQIGALDKNSVKYSSDDHTEVAFDSDTGTALKNVTSISAVLRPDNKIDLYNGTMNLKAGEEGSFTVDRYYTEIKHGNFGVKVTNGEAKFGDHVTIHADGGITGVADGVNKTDAVNKGQLDQKADAEDLEGVVYWDEKDEKNSSIHGVTLADGVAAVDDLVLGGKSYKDAGIIAGTAGNTSVAIGEGAEAAVSGDGTKGNDGVAVGAHSYAANTSTAIGTSAHASGAESTAIGYGANAKTNGSVALGKGSQVFTADGDYVVSVGSSGKQQGSSAFTRRIINVKDGVDDTDAATYGQLKKVQEGFDQDMKGVVKWDENDENTNSIHGVKLEDGKITVTAIKANTASIGGVTFDGSGTFGNGKFQAYQDGAFAAADRKFIVTNQGVVTAVAGNFGNIRISEDGTITGLEESTDKTAAATVGQLNQNMENVVKWDANDDGYIDGQLKGVVFGGDGKLTAGNVALNGADGSAISVGDGSFRVYDDGAFQAAGRKFIVKNDGSVSVDGKISVSGVSPSDGSEYSAVLQDEELLMTNTKSDGEGPDSRVTTARYTSDQVNLKAWRDGSTLSTLMQAGQINLQGIEGAKIVIGSVNENDAFLFDIKTGVHSVFSVGKDGRLTSAVGGSIGDVEIAGGKVDGVDISSLVSSGIVAGTNNSTGSNIVLGEGSYAGSNQTTVLGNDAKTNDGTFGSVALGNESVVYRDDVYVDGKQDSHGVVSVGDSSMGGFQRRIINVAAGVNANDAVIVSQFGGTNGSSFLGAVGNVDWSPLSSGTTPGAFSTFLKKVDGINWDTISAVGNINITQDDVEKLNSVDWKGALETLSEKSAIAGQTKLAAFSNYMTEAPAEEKDAQPKPDEGKGNVTVEGDKTTVNGDVQVNGSANVSDNLTVGKDLTVGGNATFNGEATFNQGASMAGNKLTDVADGEISETSKDAVNGSQLWDEQQARIDGDAALGNQINDLGRSVSKLGGEIDSVGAISAALAGLHPLDYDPTNSKYQLSAALGSYDGSSAVAFGGFYNINKDILLSAGVSTVLKGERKTAGNLGVTFRVGSGSSGEAAAAANLKEANQQLAALRQDNKVLATKNDKLTEALSAQGEKLNAQGEELAALKAQVEALLKGTQPAKTAEVKEAKTEAKAETKAEVNTEAKAEAADVKADTQAAETDKK